MLYHVRTGDIKTKTTAKTPRQAAIQAIKYSEETPGMCVIVSEQEIIEEEHSDSHFFFITDSIMEECLCMRLVR
jgi:hypothetical protein